MIKTDRIKNQLELNYNLKTNKYNYFPKTNKELKDLVDGMINKFGNRIDLNNICVSYVNDFNYVFLEKKLFNGDVSEWDVSNGLNFDSMFIVCSKFNSDLSKWDVFNGVNFKYMFYGCKSFNSNLSEWDVSNGEYFNYMFYNCYRFNSDLSRWDVSNAKNWFLFAENSLLEKYNKRIPKKFRDDYL